VGELVRRLVGGDQVIASWSSADPGSYDAAAAALRRELEQGHSAARVDGQTLTSVTELPEDADVVVVTTAMGGG
jgi:hypothetical protein